ncbi:hypothetical protein [Capnocytophaga granulosa]|jgi:hypothetical protein|uniref:hypothetical protein n=1 Tax=Capnocytophaga granulosa TaxID=45242 RepID=UPI0038574115
MKDIKKIKEILGKLIEISEEDKDRQLIYKAINNILIKEEDIKDYKSFIRENFPMLIDDEFFISKTERELSKELMIYFYP